MTHFAHPASAVLSVALLCGAYAAAPAAKLQPAANVRTHEPSAPAAAARHRQACQQGDAAACHAAALDSYYAPASPATDREALHYFQRACEAGYAPSCNGLGVLYAEGRGTARDPVRAAQLYRMACEGGASTGCEHFAQALKQGRGVIQDEAAAERASARAKCVFQATLASRDLASCPGL